MSEPGRPKALDSDKQTTVCSLVASGVSVRQAAHYLGCAPKSIRREAERNGEFRAQLAKARSEARMHPLETLRQAATTNWRAALAWMERLEPDRFARPDASVITKMEANQFVDNLIETIEKTVSNPRNRNDLFQLLSAALPAAMSRRWEKRAMPRAMQRVAEQLDHNRKEENKKWNAERKARGERRFELFHEMTPYLPLALCQRLMDDWRLFYIEDPPAFNPAEADVSSRKHGPSLQELWSHSQGQPEARRYGRVEATNNAPPDRNNVPPPGRNSDDNAPPARANELPDNDLQAGGGAKSTE